MDLIASASQSAQPLVSAKQSIENATKRASHSAHMGVYMRVRMGVYSIIYEGGPVIVGAVVRGADAQQRLSPRPSARGARRRRH